MTSRTAHQKRAPRETPGQDLGSDPPDQRSHEPTGTRGSVSTRFSPTYNQPVPPKRRTAQPTMGGVNWPGDMRGGELHQAQRPLQWRRRGDFTLEVVAIHYRV